MAEPADQFAGIAVIVGVAPVGRVEAELAALLGGADLLVDGVDRLEDAAGQLFEFAQLYGLVDAVVLEVLVVHGIRVGLLALLGDLLEGALAGHGQPIHIGELAVVGPVVVVGRSVGGEGQTRERGISVVVEGGRRGYRQLRRFIREDGWQVELAAVSSVVCATSWWS